MNEMNDKTEKRGWCGGRRMLWIPLVVVAAFFVFGMAVMYLWNAVIPSIFASVGTITFWQAIGLLVLSKILFHGGGFRGRCGCGGGWRGRRARAMWKDKWMNMSDEEKAKFKEEWKNRCGDKC